MGAKNIMICGKDEGKINGNLYYKGYVKDTVRFSEPTNSTVFSNKDLVKLS